MKKTSVLLIISLCVCILLASCGNQFDILDAEFTKNPVKLSEAENGLGSVFGLNKNLELTQWNGIIYAFESSIPLQDRESCIQTTAKILERIGTNREFQLNIYGQGTYNATFINEGSVFTHVQDWTSPEFVSSLLYGLFGEYCNYGMVSGYANYLCHELYKTPLDTCGSDWTYSGSQNALDLNLLCFRPEFVEEDDIENLKLLSNTFVFEFIGAHGESEFQSLLEKSGNTNQVEEFNHVLSAFYAERHIDHIPSAILYRLGGRSYDYIAKCDWASMYIEKDWTDKNKDICPYTYDNFLHQNYDDVRQFFSINAEQMVKYQQLFNLNSYDHDLHVYFTNHTGANSSYYNYKFHAIGLENTGSFMHEYIHALTFDHILPEAWNGEGMAKYYCHRYDYYGNAMSTADYNAVADSGERRYQFVREYRDKLGRDINMDTDYEDIMDLTVYAFQQDDPNDGGGYAPGASFIGYLISRFGEEKVIDILLETHDFGEFTYEELVTDWNTYINETYSEYTRSK